MLGFSGGIDKIPYKLTLFAESFILKKKTIIPVNK